MQVYLFHSHVRVTTHIRTECKFSQWNVLTTRGPRIAFVDNKTDIHAHLLPVPLNSPSQFDKQGVVIFIFCLLHQTIFL